MNRRGLILAACVALAGCAGSSVQTPLQLVASNDTAAAKPIPTADLTGAQGMGGQFSVTLGNGAVLNGSFTAQSKPGPITSLGGPVLDSYGQTTYNISMVATGNNQTMRCTGTRTATALDVTCTLSDGAVYEGTQSYQAPE